MSVFAATTSPLAAEAEESSFGYVSATDHELDRDRACLLAVWQGFDGQARAQRAVNAARLSACEVRYKELSQNCTVQKGYIRRPHVETWLEEFPSKYSKQNSVLVGLTWSVKKTE
jgi:hypothetical protein